MAFPKNAYGAIALTGGAQGALDAIDGAALDDLDVAVVTTATLIYFYSLDIDSGLAESSPSIISPDTNAGNKRWILVGVFNRVVADTDADTKIQVEESADEDKIRMDVKGVEAFLLDDAGVLTLSKQSAARAYLSAGQAIPNESWTKVNLDTESYDVQNEFNVSTYRFTASKAGKYLILSGFRVETTQITADDGWHASIKINGAFSTGGFCTATLHSSYIHPLGNAGLDVVELAANDYVEQYLYQSSGAERTTGFGANAVALMLCKIA